MLIGRSQSLRWSRLISVSFVRNFANLTLKFQAQDAKKMLLTPLSFVFRNFMSSHLMSSRRRKFELKCEAADRTWGESVTELPDDFMKISQSWSAEEAAPGRPRFSVHNMLSLSEFPFEPDLRRSDILGGGCPRVFVRNRKRRLQSTQTSRQLLPMQ